MAGCVASSVGGGAREAGEGEGVQEPEFTWGLQE